ncbi:MAG: EVE domain-containing protein [Kangiellaceae bacterium]|nr:EVE domain-containing protein [Kangiellaceae bacterium]MCW9017862.1 EVE domain-containing protein [Kangiellaceae bacterium]
MNYWLFKSEPSDFSLDDLKKSPNKTTLWEGIRNYQARNLLRDKVKVGDGVLFYHSQCKQVGVVGTAEVVKSAYPDPFQFDKESKYFDAKSDQSNPRWVCVDIKYESELANIVTLKEIKADKKLSEMVLVKQGRLSIQPVTKAEWNHILKLAKPK